MVIADEPAARDAERDVRTDHAVDHQCPAANADRCDQAGRLDSAGGFHAQPMRCLVLSLQDESVRAQHALGIADVMPAAGDLERRHRGVLIDQMLEGVGQFQLASG